MFRKVTPAKTLSIGCLYGLTLLLSCRSIHNLTATEGKDYQLVVEDGIYVEQFYEKDSLDRNRYTENNSTYVAGCELTYDYYYENKKGERFKFRENEGALTLDMDARWSAWNFEPINSLSDATIDKVVLTVEPGFSRLMKLQNPNYNQTTIKYNYPTRSTNGSFSGSTGVIENEKNIWIHPPRERFFMILELNPFPFSQAAYEIGHTWTWSLEVGSFWGD